MKRTDLDSIFTYHSPFGNQAERYVDIRLAAKVLAGVVWDHCPDSREKSLAITAIQQAVMWANASIAINEKPVPVDAAIRNLAEQIAPGEPFPPVDPVKKETQMKTPVRLAFLSLLLLGLLVTPALAQTTMNTAQKVKLTVVPVPADSIPVGTVVVWVVDGGAANGSFTEVTGEFAAFYLPIKAGTHTVRVAVVVGGSTYNASHTITVTLAPPASISIVASAPIPK